MFSTRAWFIRRIEEAGSGGGTPPPEDGDAKTLEQVCQELGLTPAQVAGRLEAGKQWERRAKASETVDRADYQRVVQERDQLRTAAMTDQEKAFEEARNRGRAEALAEQGAETVRMLARRLYAAGARQDQQQEVQQEAAEFAAMLDPMTFVTADGGIDDDKLAAVVRRYAPGPDTGIPTTRRSPDYGGGRRGGAPSESGMDKGRALYEQRHPKP